MCLWLTGSFKQIAWDFGNHWTPASINSIFSINCQSQVSSQRDSCGSFHFIYPSIGLASELSITQKHLDSVLKNKVYMVVPHAPKWENHVLRQKGFTDPICPDSDLWPVGLLGLIRAAGHTFPSRSYMPPLFLGTCVASLSLLGRPVSTPLQFDS